MQLRFCRNSLSSVKCWLDWTLHVFSPPERFQLSAEEGQCHWMCWRRIGCEQGPLGSHTSPGTLLSQGFGTQALPQVCTVLTPWTATCCSGGTPENAIAKSCVELVRKKSQLSGTRAVSCVESRAPCWCECAALDPAAVTAADAALHPSRTFFADCSFLSVRNAAGRIELCVKDFCYSCTQN